MCIVGVKYIKHGIGIILPISHIVFPVGKWYNYKYPRVIKSGRFSV